MSLLLSQPTSTRDCDPASAIDPRCCTARCLSTLLSTELDLREREHVMAVMDVIDEDLARGNAEDPDLGEVCPEHNASCGSRWHSRWKRADTSATPRAPAGECAVASPPSASAHSSAAACVLRRSTARTSRSDPLSKSQKVAAMQAKLERSRKRRVAAEKRVTDLRRQLEVLSTGYNVYGRMKRDETKLSTTRKRELNEIKWLNHALGLEHERRRVLAHAEADKAAFMASLKK